MSIIAIIPARYSSSRFPGKPLADLKGKTMIQIVYEQVSNISIIDKVIIATDDERIFNHAKNIGAEVMMTSADHINGTSRIAEVVEKLSVKYDNVLNIQGDEPFVHKAQIETLCDVIKQENTQIASLAKKINEERELSSPNTVKVVINKQGKALYFSRFCIPYQRNNIGNHYKHIGMYAFKASVIEELINLPISTLEEAESLEQLRWLDNGYEIKMGITDYDSLGIDTPEDLIEAIKRL